MAIFTNPFTKQPAKAMSGGWVVNSDEIDAFHQSQALELSSDKQHLIDAEILCKRAQVAFGQLNKVPASQIDEFLLLAASLIHKNRAEILKINQNEVKIAKEKELSKPLVNRMMLNEDRIKSMVESLRTISAIPSPLWQKTAPQIQPSGLSISKMRVPIGVIAIIYESRPHVTSDAAAIAIKAGNVSILRGGSECHLTSMAIGEILTSALIQTGLPADSIQVVPHSDRQAVRALISQPKGLDLIIPRGGESLIKAVSEHAKAPVLKHLSGNCHVYIHETAHPTKAVDIAINAKCYRPEICGAAETILIDASSTETLKEVIEKLKEYKVEIRGCKTTRAISSLVRIATEEDWSEEYLDNIVAIKVVNGVSEAIEHINKYGSRHTDSIVTEDKEVAEKFLREVDSSSVMVNTPTCFADGAEYGLGAEVGISTDKIHARGPVGVYGLTSEKYIVQGDGQVR